MAGQTPPPATAFDPAARGKLPPATSNRRRLAVPARVRIMGWLLLLIAMVSRYGPDARNPSGSPGVRTCSIRS